MSFLLVYEHYFADSIDKICITLIKSLVSSGLRIIRVMNLLSYFRTISTVFLQCFLIKKYL